jgi:hypothetical protein
MGCAFPSQLVRDIINHAEREGLGFGHESDGLAVVGANPMSSQTGFSEDFWLLNDMYYIPYDVAIH